MIGSLEVEIKALQITRYSIFVKLIPQELMVLFLTVGTIFSLLIAAMGAACWSVLVVTKNFVNKILADWHFLGKDGEAWACRKTGMVCGANCGCYPKTSKPGSEDSLKSPLMLAKPENLNIITSRARQLAL